jgi:hypothetical protein
LSAADDLGQYARVAAKSTADDIAFRSAVRAPWRQSSFTSSVIQIRCGRATMVCDMKMMMLMEPSEFDTVYVDAECPNAK